MTFISLIVLLQCVFKDIVYTVSQVKVNKKYQRKIVNIFLPINFNINFGCSKEPSHLDGFFEYPQHMFWLRNKKIKFSLHTLN